jgi:hypothetical protein
VPVPFHLLHGRAQTRLVSLCAPPHVAFSYDLLAYPKSLMPVLDVTNRASPSALRVDGSLRRAWSSWGLVWPLQPRLTTSIRAARVAAQVLRVAVHVARLAPTPAASDSPRAT